MAPSSHSPRLATRQLVVVIVAYFSFAAIAMPETGLGVAWPSMQRTFGVSLDALGMLLILSRVGLVLASFNSGRLAARFGQGLLLAAGSGLRALALLGYALAPTWPVLLAASIVSGIGGGTITAGLNAYFAVSHGPRLMNWLHASFGVGALLGPALMTVILNASRPWQLGYLVAATLQLGLTVAFLATRRGWSTGAETGSTVTTSESSSPASPWRSGLIWLSMALFFLSAGIEATTGQWSFTLFTEGRAAPVAQAGFWVSAYWLSFTVVRIGFGFIAERLAPSRVIRAGTLLALLGALLLTVNLADSMGHVSMVLMGVSLAPIAPLLTSTTPQRLGRRWAVSGVGFQVGAASIGIALLPALAGLLAARISIEVLGPFLVAMSLLFWALFEMTNFVVRRRQSTPAESAGEVHPRPRL